MVGVLVVLPLVLTGCVRSAVTPLSANTIEITSSAAPACGRIGAQKIACQRAAIETIKRGYDKYIIAGGNYQNNVGVAGYTPVVANSYGSATASSFGNTTAIRGQSTTTVSGGTPIIAGSHDQGIVVRMFRDGDPQGANAISARDALGPTWPELIKKGLVTTC